MLHRRRAGRVILLDSQDRLLLLQGHDPSLDAAPWWFTPGGGAEEGESQKQAALRELFEETGLHLSDVEGPIWTREAAFDFNGDHYEQSEEFYLARIDSHDVDTSRWTPLENETVLTTKWWSASELLASSETIYPAGLGGLVATLLRVGPPKSPVALHQ